MPQSTLVGTARLALVPEGEDGLKSEIEYWKGRLQKFATLSEQSRSHESRVIREVLTMARSSAARTFKALEGLEPGALLVLPCAVGHSPIMLIVERRMTPCEHLCTLTIVSCDPENLAYHRATAEPPKIKFATCLTLTQIDFKKLSDEAFWAVLWFAATSDAGGQVSPIKMLYGLLLSFLAEASLEQAMLRTEAEGTHPPEMRTPRRSTARRKATAFAP